MSVEWRRDLSKAFDAWDQKYIVTGTDIDALASAALIRRVYPSAIVIALYDLKSIIVLHPAARSVETLKSALWVDLDVLAGIVCIGQHQIAGNNLSEPIPHRCALSFNPNTSFRVTHNQGFCGDSNIRGDECSKYPFSTFAFLAHYFDAQLPRAGVGQYTAADECMLRAIVRHADSAAHNMYAFHVNATNWKRAMFDDTNSLVHSVLLETSDIWQSTQCLCCECASKSEQCCCMRQAVCDQLRLMVALHDLMPNCFDGNSRSSTNKHARVDMLRYWIDAPPSGMHSETAQVFAHLLGGYQGIVRVDHEQFLAEFNAFYAFICRIVGASEQVFDSVETIPIAHGCNTVTIRLVQNQLYVVGVPLNEFLVRQTVFSYAILHRNALRYTADREFKFYASRFKSSENNE